MVAAVDGVNDARLDHDQRHNRIRRLVHDMHHAPEAPGIRRDAGKRVRHTAGAFRMQQNRVRLVAGTGLSDRLTRTGDRRGLRRPILAALPLRLQRVMPRRHAARFADEAVLIGAESAEIPLPSVNVHRARRSPVVRIIAFDDNADPTVLGTLGLLSRITLRPVNRPGSRQPAHRRSNQGPLTLIRRNFPEPSIGTEASLRR